MLLDQLRVHSVGMLFDVNCTSHCLKVSRVVFPIMVLTVHCGNYQMRQHKTHIMLLFYVELLTNQRPVVTKSRASIAVFSVRKNMPAGGKVTLRSSHLVNFYYLLLYGYFKHFIKKTEINGVVSKSKSATFASLFATFSDFGGVLGAAFDRYRGSLWFTLNFCGSVSDSRNSFPQLLSRFWFSFFND